MTTFVKVTIKDTAHKDRVVDFYTHSNEYLLIGADSNRIITEPDDEPHSTSIKGRIAFAEGILANDFHWDI